jgi:hypothetical protein
MKRINYYSINSKLPLITDQNEGQEDVDNSLDVDNEDFLAYERYDAALIDLVKGQEIFKEGLHLSSVESSLAELRAVVDQLSQQDSRLDEEINALRSRKDSDQGRLRKLIESNKKFRIREQLKLLRSTAILLQRNKDMAPLTEQIQDLQLKCARMKLRRLERNEELLLSTYK